MELGRTIAALVLDWDGTAIPRRRASAAALRARLEKLSSLGVHTAVVSSADLSSIDAQIRARPPGPGRLLLALNRGSELFAVDASGPVVLARQEEASDITRRLDAAVEQAAAALRARGLAVVVEPCHLNRRTIDLIPGPDLADPADSRTGVFAGALQDRLRRGGFTSIAQVVRLASQVAEQCGVPQPRVRFDGGHVEVGLTDMSDSMRQVLGVLAEEGVAGELVLVVGDEFGALGGMPGRDASLLVPEAVGVLAISVGAEPSGVPAGVRHVGGGSAAFLGIVDEQVRRARLRRVPEICRDPRWTIVERGVDVARHRVTESLFTVISGGIGLRGSVEETTGYGHPLVVANGVYQGQGDEAELLRGPDVVDVAIDPPVQEDIRILDLHTGVLHRREVEDEHRPAFRSLRFGSVVEPGVIGMRLEAGRGRLHLSDPEDGWRDGWSAVRSGSGGIGAVRDQLVVRDREVETVQRMLALHGSPSGEPSRTVAETRLARARARGFERLLAAQRSTWAQRWRRVGVEIPDDPTVELGIRFALFQLWGLADGDAELAVGARGLTGSGYAGHVFWDADVFVLPALVSIDPAAATAMVNYRINRLDAARERARAEGRGGARFPWESAHDGRDVTPEVGSVGAESVPILTGSLEEHITADVAWAAVRNATWTRSSGRLTKSERVLLAETARYWVSRMRTDTDGSLHIDGVIGPDEYHENVNDNAFTNVMARWNLRSAARRAAAPAGERRTWSELAARLVDGYDRASGLYEQFDGYHSLEPLLVRDLADPPIAADVLAGRDRVAASQVIKQPDVLMIHHLLPEDAQPGSLAANLDFYMPRTAHGSSLSPAISALLHARAGRPDEAAQLLTLSLRIDLDDLGGTTSGGVHIGACGGAWQAVVHGFLGASVANGVLRLDPVLPRAWSRLEARFRCIERDVRVRVDGDRLTVDASAGLAVQVADSVGLHVATESDVVFTQEGKR
ncbi:hypothetical protein GCM10027448_04200 [Nocardioides dilutus]